MKEWLVEKIPEIEGPQDEEFVLAWVLSILPGLTAQCQLEIFPTIKEIKKGVEVDVYYKTPKLKLLYNFLNEQLNS